MATRLSPGVWRLANGKTVKSATDPDKASSSKSSSKKTNTKASAGTPYKTQGDFVQGAQDSVDYQAKTNERLNRVGQSNSFGSREFVTNPDGSVTAKDSLSPDQQGLLDAQLGLEGDAARQARAQLSGAGLDQAFDAKTSARTITPENFAGQRQQIEDQTYKGLTRDYEKRYGQQKQQLEQDLYSRGYRPDQTTTEGAGSWNDMQSGLNKDWNDAYAGAADQARQAGGQEFDRLFGAQEDVIASQFGQAQQTRQQRVGDIKNLNAVGTGVRDPGYFGLSPVQVGNPDFAGTALGFGQLQETSRANKANASISRAQLAAAGANRGRGGAPAKEDPGYDIV